MKRYTKSFRFQMREDILAYPEGLDQHVYGSANLIQTLLKHDLVDELWLKTYPITLGSGKRLFDYGAIPVAFTLVEAAISSKGVIVASYRRTGEVEVSSV